MAVRTVEFRVSESGILPSSQQFGGVQGEHRATVLVFTLEDDLFEKISASAEGNRVVYRFEAYDGAGGVRATEPLDLVDGALQFYLEEWQTRFGGNVSVFLVITEVMNDSTEMELYSFPAVLRLKSRPDGEAVEGENYESVSTLVESAKNSAKNARESAEAATESLDELLASVPDVDVLEVSDGVEITVTEKDKVSVAKVRNGEKGDKGDKGEVGPKGDKGDKGDVGEVSLKYAHSSFANALKGSASGEGYAVAKDVSPLEHEIKVQLSDPSGEIGGEESVSQTATLNGDTRELLLDEPSDKVRVTMEQIDHYCDGAIVPLVDGDDLIAVSEVAVSPALYHGEQLSLLDITYTITDNILSWKGTYTVLTADNGETTEISGSYTLSSSGQKIIGFCQIYDRPEDNPDYSYGGEGVEHSLDIIVSVYKSSFLGVPVTVGGKNLFDVAKNCAADNIYINASGEPLVYYDGDVITTYFGNSSVFVNLYRKVKPYKAGSYTATLFPVTEGATMNFILYRGSNKNEEISHKTVGAVTGNYTYSFTVDEDFYFTIGGSGGEYRKVYSYRVQLEQDGASEYEPYIEPVTYTANADGSVDGVKSVYPSISVSVEDSSTVVNVEYNRDINKAFAELSAAVISLGGNV